MSKAVIERFKPIFVRHNIPFIFFKDNESQLTSFEKMAFVKNHNFDIVTRSLA